MPWSTGKSIHHWWWGAGQQKTQWPILILKRDEPCCCIPDEQKSHFLSQSSLTFQGLGQKGLMEEEVSQIYGQCLTEIKMIFVRKFSNYYMPFISGLQAAEGQCSQVLFLYPHWFVSFVRLVSAHVDWETCYYSFPKDSLLALLSLAFRVVLYLHYMELPELNLHVEGDNYEPKNTIEETSVNTSGNCGHYYYKGKHLFSFIVYYCFQFVKTSTFTQKALWN